jgi:peptidoglycan L-alanyl-D-glutamate endopeptidase CwlK
MRDAISNQRLVGSHPAVIARCNAADSVLAAQGIGYRIVEAGRSFAESNADYAKGRTAPGPKVTNAPAGYSWHNFNMAVDCVPFVVGEGGDVDWNVSDEHFQAMIRALTDAGLPLRGGCKGDNDHFELLEIPAVPTDDDRAAFTSGGLEAVWAQYTIPEEV